MRVRGQFAMGCPLAKNIGNSQSKYGTDRYSIVIYCESNKIQLTYKTVSKDMNVMKITYNLYVSRLPQRPRLTTPYPLRKDPYLNRLKENNFLRKLHSRILQQNSAQHPSTSPVHVPIRSPCSSVMLSWVLSL